MHNAIIIVINLQLENLLIYDYYFVTDPANVSVSPSVLVRGFNEQGSLVCTGFGIPPPTLSWSRRSGSISDSEFSTLPTNNGFNESTLTLTLLNTRRTLEGMYVCNGVNNINNLIGALDENEGIFFIEGSYNYNYVYKNNIILIFFCYFS